MLESARGWAACILFNDVIRKQFQWFIEQEDRFSLGVCNGCQLMSQINYVPFRIADRAKQPRFIQNKAGKLECRFVNVKIEQSNSIFTRGMGNYCEDYPYNPNGSENGIAALCSENGHHLSMMPHP